MIPGNHRQSKQVTREPDSDKPPVNLPSPPEPIDGYINIA